MDGKTSILFYIRIGKVLGGLGRIHWIDGTDQKLCCIHRKKNGGTSLPHIFQRIDNRTGLS